MGHAICTCGHRMSSVNCPSEDILIIFSKASVMEAVKNTPAMSLVEFEMDREKEEYWYCHACKRVYDYYIKPPFSVNRRFQKCSDISGFDVGDIHDDWLELYVFSDKKLTTLEMQSEDNGEGIAEFFKKYLPDVRFFMSPDGMIVYGVSQKIRSLKCVYSVELVGGRRIWVNSNSAEEHGVYGCACGYKLTNAFGHSDAYYLIEHHVLANAGQKTPDLLLSELVAKNISCEYWGCPRCGRINVLENAQFGGALKVFKRCENASVSLDECRDWRRYERFEIECGKLATIWNDKTIGQVLNDKHSVWLISPDGTMFCNCHEDVSQVVDAFRLEWEK